MTDSHDDQDALPPELVADYRIGLGATAGELERGLAEGADGAARVRRLAHQLKGSGGSYGFPEVTRLAAEVEVAPEERFAAAVAALVTLLRAVAGTATQRMLVVDDDPVVTQILRATLAAPGRDVQVAATGAEADELVGRTPFDLILLDLFLPDEDGRRLLTRWRAAPATARVPVFVLSARLGTAIKTECFALGADAYFEKPVDPEMLAAAVSGRLARTPAAPAAVAAAADPAPSRSPAVARILLAEDDPLVASIVTHRLGRERYTVRHVGDGAAAVEAVRQDRPDLLILDVKMPVMDGLEALRRIRALADRRALPIIILTALGNERDLVHGFELGADDYLVKPFSPAELAVRVDRLVRRP
ncbi:MAG TPA: response regulator [Longimicrobiales bacterium]|nr:response regulator [Longimicrobiales bacterium]